MSTVQWSGAGGGGSLDGPRCAGGGAACALPGTESSPTWLSSLITCPHNSRQNGLALYFGASLTPKEQEEENNQYRKTRYQLWKDARMG